MWHLKKVFFTCAERESRDIFILEFFFIFNIVNQTSKPWTTNNTNGRSNLSLRKQVVFDGFNFFVFVAKIDNTFNSKQKQ